MKSDHTFYRASYYCLIFGIALSVLQLVFVQRLGERKRDHFYAMLP